jgi:pyruvate formate lyase activating enzyme
MRRQYYLGMDDLYIARYWQKTEKNLVQCEVCPRSCILKDGQRGFCFVRQNIGGKLILTTYGRSSGFCIDPIEKKPLNHFLPGTKIFSFGTAGCNMGCIFCQNWGISKAKAMDAIQEEATPEQIALSAKKSGCLSVAFTYNDPSIFLEYAIDTAKCCHDLGLATVAVTAGYIKGQARADLYSVMDAANIDLKGFSEEFYQKYCGAHLEPILDTIKYVKNNTKVWIELTTLLIPGANDSDKELNNLADWVRNELGPDVPLHFTAFTPAYKLTNVGPTPVETLLRARDIALGKGINYVYTGNVYDKKSQSTFCPSCKKLLIERDWHAVGEYHIKNSSCAYCQNPIAGRFLPGSHGHSDPFREKVIL